jgi:hypothetical protein
MHNDNTNIMPVTKLHNMNEPNRCMKTAAQVTCHLLVNHSLCSESLS